MANQQDPNVKMATCFNFRREAKPQSQLVRFIPVVQEPPEDIVSMITVGRYYETMTVLRSGEPVALIPSPVDMGTTGPLFSLGNWVTTNSEVKAVTVSFTASTRQPIPTTGNVVFYIQIPGLPTFRVPGQITNGGGGNGIFAQNYPFGPIDAGNFVVSVNLNDTSVTSTTLTGLLVTLTVTEQV